MSSDSKTVFVGALDPAVSEAQLAAAFAPFGELTCVKIPSVTRAPGGQLAAELLGRRESPIAPRMEAQNALLIALVLLCFAVLCCVLACSFNKMCGFVEYSEAASAAAAIAAMNGVAMGNGRIRCMPGIAKPERAARPPYGGGGGGWHPHAAAAGGYAAPAYHSHSGGGWSSSAHAAAAPAESDPYTVDQDDVRADPLWPNRGVDLFKRNDAFVASRWETQLMRLGMQLTEVDSASWLR